MCNVCSADEALQADDKGARIWQTGPAVYVRARGKEAEGPGRYQVRRKSEEWPATWKRTDDLAGVMGRYGFDVHYYLAHPAVKAWARGKREDFPTLRDIRWTEADKAARAKLRRARMR